MLKENPQKEKYTNESTPIFRWCKHRNELWLLGNKVMQLRQQLDQDQLDTNFFLKELLELINDVRTHTFSMKDLGESKINEFTEKPKENHDEEFKEFLKWNFNEINKIFNHINTDKPFQACFLLGLMRKEIQEKLKKFNI